MILLRSEASLYQFEGQSNLTLFTLLCDHITNTNLTKTFTDTMLYDCRSYVIK